MAADAVRIEQVVCNLLDNAIKYTPEGGHIELRLARTDEPGVRVHVKDDGPGIAPAQRREVFELFTRGALDLSTPGLGVGLALCRQIARLHGGRIELAPPNSNGGSEFILQLPFGDAVPARRSKRPGAPSTARDSRPSAPVRRVLIVEDNADAALSLSFLLRTWGAESAIAGDAETAIAVADEFRPDLVLLDIGLPGESGHTVARQLRERFGKAVRLVAVTGFGRDDDRRQALAAGCDEHMTKPVAPARLRELLGPATGT